MVKLNIFVSYSYHDLKDIRNNLESFIDNFGYETVLFEKEKISYTYKSPLDESCNSEIANCHIFS